MRHETLAVGGLAAPQFSRVEPDLEARGHLVRARRALSPEASPDPRYTTLTYKAISEKDPQALQRLLELRQMAAAKPDRITLFVLQDVGTNFSAIPPTEGGMERYGVFTAPYQDGRLWAHELGHHFCLYHTFTFNDPQPPDFDPVEHDADKEVEGDDASPMVTDTPPDPGILEKYRPELTPKHYDVAANGAWVEGHEWCEHHKVGEPAHPATDPGSLNPFYCTVRCWRAVGAI